MSNKRSRSNITIESGSEQTRGNQHGRPQSNMRKVSFPKQLPAKIVVAIDFGTTFSGFAYALSSDIEKVYVYYDWPGQHIAEAKPYCKTHTSLWYLPGSDTNEYELQEWGWKAIWNHKMALQRLSREQGTNPNYAQEFRSCGYLATKFKLHLAPYSTFGMQTFQAAPLPQGLTAQRLISDYLRCMSEFIITALQQVYGSYISKNDVQWCLTVPAIWDQAAKQQMVECAELAGLARGRLCKDKSASPHSLIIVLEPEAASVFCQKKLKEVNFNRGSKFLVVDVGGGTVDLVMHEKVDDSGVKVKELACSSGDLCGGTYVDEAFYGFITKKIGCFKTFSATSPASVFRIQEYIEKVKCSFDGDSDSFLDYLDIPARLAKAWEADDIAKGGSREDGMYDTLSISRDDLESIFSTVVAKILQLIENQLDGNPTLEAILVVGGFSSSPYLMRRIREKFSHLCRILNPVDPGSAVCHGAVAFGAINAEVMLSRKSRRTYGISMSRRFKVGDPPEKRLVTSDGRIWCRDVFDLFVKIGDDIPVNHSVKHFFFPLERTATRINIRLFATSDTSPVFVTDRGMELIDHWTFPIPREARTMNAWPSIQVEMFFGRSMIEVVSNPDNFRGPSTFTSVKLDRFFV